VTVTEHINFKPCVPVCVSVCASGGPARVTVSAERDERAQKSSMLLC